MYDSIALQKLNELIASRNDGFLLNPDSSKTINDYLALVEKFQTAEADERTKIEKKVLKMFGLKRGEDGYGYEASGNLENPVLLLLKEKIGDSSLLNLRYAKQVCEQFNNVSFKWKLLIERTQKCLKDEKFKADLKPIVALHTEQVRIDRESVEAFFVVIVIINLHSFIRLKISAERVEERVQRAIRKDIIDIMLVRDKHLEFAFHSIREKIALELGNYKEARELQEAIHAIRNSSMFPKPNR